MLTTNRPAIKRPISITIVAWIEIFGGLLAQLVFAVARFANSRHIASVVQSRIPFGLQMALSEVGIIVMVASGVGMLRGLNWARFVYIAWAGLALARGAVLFHLTPQQLIILAVGSAKYGVFIYFLTRSDANNYFKAARISVGRCSTPV